MFPTYVSVCFVFDCVGEVIVFSLKVMVFFSVIFFVNYSMYCLPKCVCQICVFIGGM